MKKYWIVAKNTWAEVATYRIDFVIWRIRSVIQLLTAYFLWIAVLPQNAKIGDYNQPLMLTYILGTSIISAIALSSRTQEIGENINNGDLSIFLLRPINYFGYWFWKDIGDKMINIIFSIVEIIIIFLVLKPPFFVQTDVFYLFPFFTTVIIAVFLYFFLSSLLGLFGFWSADVWAPRFIFFVILGFFTGGFFPLDILPKQIFEIFRLLPFSYLLYFPLKIYLGQLSMLEILKGIFISLLWVLLFYRILFFVWLKGLRNYTAQGR